MVANAAWHLASVGKKVLIIDADLRSPTLLDYFSAFRTSPEERRRTDAPGLVDMVQALEAEVGRATAADARKLCDDHAKVDQYYLNLTRERPLEGIPEGSIHYLGPGRTGDSGYQSQVNMIVGSGFLASPLSKEFVRSLRRSALSQGYHYVLVDTPSDPGEPLHDHCTTILPDQVALCFPLTESGIGDALRAATHIRDGSSGQVLVRPIPTRVDVDAEDVEGMRDKAAEDLGEHMPGRSGDEVARYLSKVEIPQRRRVGNDRILAAFVDRPQLQGTLFSTSAQMVRTLTGVKVPEDRHLTERQRDVLRGRSLGRSWYTLPRVELLFHPRDRGWADWIQAQLEWAGSTVTRLAPESDGPPTAESRDRTVLLVMSKNLPNTLTAERAMQIRHSARGTGSTPGLVGVKVSEGVPDEAFGDVDRVSLHLHDEDDARQTLLDNFGGNALARRRTAPVNGPRFPGYRFSGSQPGARLHGPLENLPVSDPHFTGRQEIIQRMRDTLGYTMDGKPWFALTGLSGIGKSAIAREFADQFRFDYDLQWWIPAQKPDLAEAALASLASEAGFTATGDHATAARALLGELTQGRRWPRVLLVFDGACNVGDLRDLIPQDGCHVIVTTYHQEWRGLENVAWTEVPTFDPTESREVLRRRLRNLPEAVADELADKLGHLPPRLRQAAEAINARNLRGHDPDSAQEFLRLLEESAVQDGGDTTAPSPVTPLLLDELGDFHPASLRLLELCAFLDLDAIDPRLLRSAPAVREYGDADREIRDGSKDTGAVTHQVTRFLLVENDEENHVFRIHRSVRDQVLDRMSTQERARRRTAVQRVLASCAPSDEQPHGGGHDALYRQLARHVECSGALDSTDEEVRRWLTNQVRHLCWSNDNERAERWAERLFHQWTERFGEEDVLRLRVGTQWANALANLGENARAESVNKQTLDLLHSTQGPRNRYSLLAQQARARDLRFLGRFNEALEHDQAAHQFYLEELGADDREVLRAEHNLSLSLVAVGDYQSARDTAQRVFEARARVLKDRDRSTWYTGYHLGTYMRLCGEHASAELQLGLSIDGLTETVGASSSHTLHAVKELAATRRRMGEFDAALEESRRAYELHRRLHGALHARSLDMGVELAACLAAKSRFEDALGQAEHNLDAHTRVYGQEHPRTHVARSHLSAYHERLADAETSLSLAERAHSGLAADPHVGPNHPFTLGAAINLANSLVANGEPDKALKLDTDTDTAYRDRFGPSHPHSEIAAANWNDSTNRRKNRKTGSGGRSFIDG
ncbi:hypothetical protein BJF83_08810 [Nocardiopsis sp. CNR-923]|nr:hypothetical protein BJF83_08810 [Nocardiopsis sp. CNR-923]